MLMNPHAYEMLVALVVGGMLLLWAVYRWVLMARRGSKPLPPPVTAACRPPAPPVCRTKTGVVLRLVEDQTPPHALGRGCRVAA